MVAFPFSLGGVGFSFDRVWNRRWILFLITVSSIIGENLPIAEYALNTHPNVTVFSIKQTSDSEGLVNPFLLIKGHEFRWVPH